MTSVFIKTTISKEDKKQIQIEGVSGTSRFDYLCEPVRKSGVTIIKNYSVGIAHSPYASIDSSGSVKGMRKNYGWENDKVVKAHDAYFNLDRIRISHPLDALAYWMEQNTHIDIVDKHFEMKLDSDQFKVEVRFL